MDWYLYIWLDDENIVFVDVMGVVGMIDDGLVEMVDGCVVGFVCVDL